MCRACAHSGTWHNVYPSREKYVSFIFQVFVDSLLYYSSGIIYLSMPLHDQERGPKELLEPYLKVILSTKSPPYNSLFQMYYTQHFPACQTQSAPVDSNDENLWVFPLVPPDISHGVDFAAQVAEKAFWKVVSSVRGPDASLDVSNGFWVDSMHGVDEDSD